jgi:hypothetical protein
MPWWVNDERIAVRGEERSVLRGDLARVEMQSGRAATQGGSANPRLVRVGKS